MGNSSRRKTLGDYVTLQRGTTYWSRLLDQPGPVLLGLASIRRNGGFRPDALRTYGGESPERLLVRPGEVYVSLKDVTQSADLLGAAARLPVDHAPGRLTQDTVKLEPRAPDAPMNYLYWLMRTPAYRSYCRAHATGTTNLGLPREDFLAFPVPEPGPVQMCLVNLLNDLEDKIELNRRMNETLEAMARALFKSWFVDFEPVWAKAEGRDTGLPSRVEDLFPESVVTTELGEIPTGWGISAFSDTVDVLGGGTPKTSIPEYWNGDIPWFSVVDAPRDSDVWVMGTAKYVTQSGIENSAARVLPTGTTIISARGTVGRVALTGVPMAMNQSCYGIRGRVGANGYFTYFATRELAALLKQHAHGSVFDTITRDTLASVSVVSPPERLVLEFEELVAPILQRIRVNLTANRVLAELRDSLLPKLISGEIRARDAERLIGETSP